MYGLLFESHLAVLLAIQSLMVWIPVTNVEEFCEGVNSSLLSK